MSVAVLFLNELYVCNGLWAILEIYLDMKPAGLEETFMKPDWLLPGAPEKATGLIGASAKNLAPIN